MVVGVEGSSCYETMATTRFRFTLVFRSFALSPPPSVCARDCLAIGLARVGQDTQRIVSGTLEELMKVDFGPPLHSLVLAAPKQHVHDLELELVKRYAVKEGVTPMLPPPAPPAAAGSDSDSDN